MAGRWGGGSQRGTKGVVCTHICITNGHSHWDGGGLSGVGMAGGEGVNWGGGRGNETYVNL